MKLDAFIHLVKHEARWGIQSKNSKRWGLIYLFAFILIGLVAFTIAVKDGNMKPQYMMFYGYGLPFVIMGTGYAMINKEWKNHTYGWWLSLPYSRSWLLLCKLIGALIQLLKVYLVFLLFVLILTLYAILLDNNFTLETIYNQFVSALRWLVVLLGIFPTIAPLAFLTGVLQQTKYKPLVPLMWAVMAVSINLYIQIIIMQKSSGFEKFFKNPESVAPFQLTWTLALVCIGTMLIGGLLLNITARLLNKHLSI